MKVKRKPLPGTSGEGANAIDGTSKIKPEPPPCQAFPPGNSTQVQRQRILLWLQSQPLTTLQARQELDVMHPTARVQEIRQHGHHIETIQVKDLSPSGKFHRVARYVLNHSNAPVDGIKFNG